MRNQEEVKGIKEKGGCDKEYLEKIVKNISDNRLIRVLITVANNWESKK